MKNGYSIHKYTDRSLFHVFGDFITKKRCSLQLYLITENQAITFRYYFLSSVGFCNFSSINILLSLIKMWISKRCNLWDNLIVAQRVGTIFPGAQHISESRYLNLAFGNGQYQLSKRLNAVCKHLLGKRHSIVKFDVPTKYSWILSSEPIQTK